MSHPRADLWFLHNLRSGQTLAVLISKRNENRSWSQVNSFKDKCPLPPPPLKKCLANAQDWLTCLKFDWAVIIWTLEKVEGTCHHPRVTLNKRWRISWNFKTHPCTRPCETNEARGIMGRLRKAAETKRKSGLRTFKIYYFNEKKKLRFVQKSS